MAARQIDIAFFDIGGTLGNLNAAGVFHAFPDSKALLKTMKELVGLRLGIITNLAGAFTDAQAWEMLKNADLIGHLDQTAFISDNAAPASKPDPAIFTFAASKVGVAAERCLFIGESLAEVAAAQVAGMHSILKPSE